MAVVEFVRGLMGGLTTLTLRPTTFITNVYQSGLGHWWSMAYIFQLSIWEETCALFVGHTKGFMMMMMVVIQPEKILAQSRIQRERQRAKICHRSIKSYVKEKAE